MTIVHPQVAVNGMNPDDVFYAVDELGNQVGYACILYQLLPGIYPDRPVNLYFTLEGEASVRYLLFGALIARARVKQTMNPGVPARLYTALKPEDKLMRDFYLENGFDCNDSDVDVELTIPFGDGRIPMSCAVALTPLNTWDEQDELLKRLSANGITNLDRGNLDVMRHMPHFLALGLYRNATLIGEAVMAGQGNSCELVAIYVEPSNRGQGMAKALLHRIMACMAAEGVTRVTARVMSRSLPQQRLMNAFGAVPMAVNMIFPGINLDD